MTKLRLSLLALCLIPVIYFLYSPGLSGGFWLDDFGVLPVLFDQQKAHGDFYASMAGYSGPLGRPLTLYSFVIQAESWPHAREFIGVNIILHLINCFLAFFLMRVLIPKIVKVDDRTCFFLSLAVSGLWAILPIHVSSVLYVVQRMVLLSSFFVLSSLLLFAFAWRKQEEHHCVGTFLLFTGCAILGGVGLLAKESAVLLIVYALLVWFVLSRGERPAPIFKLVPYTLGGVFLVCIVYILSKTGQFKDDFSGRDFNAAERMLTEFRVLWVYVKQILFPKLTYLGLYHDDFQISRSWLDPFSTTLAALAWVLVLLISILLRKKALVLPFAVFWFLGGHLLESTVIPLEIYFEHRNYLPSLGLCLLLVMAVFAAQKLVLSNLLKGVLVTVIAAYFAFHAFILHHIAGLWGEPLKLSHVYASERKESFRAQGLMVDFYQDLGLEKKAYEKLLEMKVQFNDQLALDLILVQFSCIYQAQFEHGIELEHITRARSAPFSNGVLLAINELIEGEKWEGECSAYRLEDLRNLIKNLRENPLFAKKKIMLNGFLARISWKMGEGAVAISYLEEVYGISYELTLLMLVYQASTGMNQEALQTLNLIRGNAGFSIKAEAQKDYLDQIQSELRK